MKYFYIALIVGSIIFAIWWVPYKFHECIKVGHSHTYCVFDIFSR